MFAAMTYSVRLLLAILHIVALTTAFGSDASLGTSPTPTTTAAAATPLILRCWENTISQDILDAFTAETGIAITLVPYTSQEEAIQDMRAGEVYDIVMLENQLIPSLTEADLLAELNYANIPNFKNISVNFRDLAYDEGNVHAIPFSWGITGLIVRTDLVDEPVTGWADLWDEDVQSRVLGTAQSRYMLGIALKSAGYSANSTTEAEVQAARDKLIALTPYVAFEDSDSVDHVAALVAGDVVIVVGHAADALAGQAENPAIEYITPAEGGLLWGENLVIPANSEHQTEAEQFINYLLSAEVSAQIANETHLWLPNDAALPLIDEEIRDNPVIFPSTDILANAELLLPLMDDAETLYTDIWNQILES